jgi:hypothetical protein
MGSIITFSNRSSNYSGVLVFDVWNYGTIPEVFVEGVKDGIFQIDAPIGALITEFLKFVVGIFEPDSNFASFVCEKFGVPESSFKGVSFEFNEVKLTVTKENANADELFKYWKAEIKKLRRRN